MFLVGVLPLDDKFYELPLKDSKRLTKEQRDELQFRIKQYAKVRIVKISSKLIDKYGLSYCYRKALIKIVEFFNNYALVKYDSECQFYFDGNANFGVKEIQTIVKGDSIYKEIMAASIIAKHKKDKEMEKLHSKYPMYEWDKNAGYLTKQHKEAIKQYGLTEYHRKSFKIGRKNG